MLRFLTGLGLQCYCITMCICIFSQVALGQINLDPCCRLNSLLLPPPLLAPQVTILFTCPSGCTGTDILPQQTHRYAGLLDWGGLLEAHDCNGLKRKDEVRQDGEEESQQETNKAGFPTGGNCFSPSQSFILQTFIECQPCRRPVQGTEIQQ